MAIYNLYKKGAFNDVIADLTAAKKTLDQEEKAAASDDETEGKPTRVGAVRSFFTGMIGKAFGAGKTAPVVVAPSTNTTSSE